MTFSQIRIIFDKIQLYSHPISFNKLHYNQGILIQQKMDKQADFNKNKKILKNTYFFAKLSNESSLTYNNVFIFSIIFTALTMTSFLICAKHNKTEKVTNKVPINAYVCMNRYCPNSFKVFCSSCKIDHRDHANKILTVEDTTFLIERLMNTPFKEVTNYVSETVDIMKKLKLIKQFRKKIDILQKQIQKDALKLIGNTESLIHEYAICKESVTHLLDMLGDIQNINTYNQFVQKSHQMLSNLDYNFKKDKFQYSNTLIKQKEDKRRKSGESAKRKIEEVRDYSMKIIEVILHNDDSQEEQDDISFRKKHYELLKQELFLDKDEGELNQEINDLKSSKSLIRISKTKKSLQDIEIQTTEQIISKQNAQFQLNELDQMHIRTQNDLRLKLSIIMKQKQTVNKELIKIKDKYEENKRTVKTIENHLRENKNKRIEKQKAREQLLDKIVQLWQWKGLSQEDKVD